MGFETEVVLPGQAGGLAGFGRERLAEVWQGRGKVGRYALGVAALALAYYAGAHLGYALQFSGAIAAIVWLPVGIGVAFLYLGGVRFWPGVVVGDLLVNNYSTLPAGSAVGQSFGNLMEVVVAVVVLRRLCPRGEPISTLRGVAGLVAAVACGTLVSAVVGSLSARFGGVISPGSLLHVWRTWWLGDFCGALIVVPLVLSWSSLPARPWRRARVAEASLMVAVVVGLSALQLGQSMMLCALVFPALIWAALSFGSRGATLAITVVCAFAVWGATNDLGPFAVGSINNRLLETQLFIATVSLSALAIAALVSERAQLAEGVRESRARLVQAADDARYRLERDLHDGTQQSLVGLQLKLNRAAQVIPDDPEEGKRLVTTIERQMDDVLADLRSLARGVYPPLLSASGLLVALQSAALVRSGYVSIRGVAMGRYSPAVEAAVYFCCLEALQNVAKHAGGDAHAEVRLRQGEDHLGFEVVDSGRGFETTAARHGRGLTNMHDRIGAVGGTLTIVSQPGTGTTVRGRVPTT